MNKTDNNTKEEKAKTYELAKWSFGIAVFQIFLIVLSIFLQNIGFEFNPMPCAIIAILLLPMSLVLGIISIIKVMKSKDRLKGAGLSISGIVISIVIILVLYWIGSLMSEVQNAVVTLNDTHEAISSYIQENQGNFPVSEDDLIQQHFLKKAKIEEKDKSYDVYFIRSFDYDPEDPENEKNWLHVRGRQDGFKALKILYGVRIEDIEVIDGKLYDKSTNQEILLIDGPHKKSTQIYESCSLQWYKLMLQEKQKLENSLKAPTESE